MRVIFQVEPNKFKRDSNFIGNNAYKNDSIFLSGIGWWFMVMATTVTIWSGIDYAKSVIKQVGIE